MIDKTPERFGSVAIGNLYDPAVPPVKITEALSLS